jgi:hypothetical protein
MNALAHHAIMVAVALLAMALGCAPVAAQQSRSVAGLVINLGIMPAEVALQADGHRDMHPARPPSGSQHLLITVDEEKSGQRIGDAQVVIEVTDPHGHVEKKPLLHTQAGGIPDYSELFRFGWEGEYSVHVIITPRSSARPIDALFTVHHSF